MYGLCMKQKDPMYGEVGGAAVDDARDSRSNAPVEQEEAQMGQGVMRHVRLARSEGWCVSMTLEHTLTAQPRKTLAKTLVLVVERMT